ncbi:copper chaperone PCu(A)C [Pseudooceanicola sp. HF7]|uniref:copper chaperone PCu(A)C n=1 Tax=Pseudooceanicola sp. HF7 TaxID=2721560 RepID=UPI001431E0A2|nr:copper chaperone PCu(A)C [Pseudooceanicola sp. HF7]NIZ08574.1 copper chaperone PCu(A)C [Pseudooceanicola sp. HF7]
MTPLRKVIPAALFCLSLAAGVTATAARADIQVSNPQLVLDPAGGSAAGYATLRNSSREPERLVGASSAQASVQLLTPGKGTLVDVGSGLTVRAKSTLRLQPGGSQLRLTDLPPGLQPGQGIKVTLKFFGMPGKQVTFPVQ